jgi:AcrR family transcriptional regulator
MAAATASKPRTARGGREAIPRLELPNGCSSRERLLEAARQLIRERGYESLEVRDIAAAADVSRQTFYNNFADKRECVAAVATDPELSEIDLQLRVAEARGSEWASQLAKALEGVLADQHASPDTPRARLLDALEHSIRERGYERTRIVHLTKAAGVGREDFYIHFADKRECLAALSGQALGALMRALQDELGDSQLVELELALAALVEALEADPHRTQLAVGELAELSCEHPADPRLAHARSFRDLLAGLAARDPHFAGQELERRVVVGALADAIEGAVIDGCQEELPELVAEVRDAFLAPLRPKPQVQASPEWADRGGDRSNGNGARPGTRRASRLVVSR